MTLRDSYFSLLAVAALVNYASTIDVENLKIGCYTESPLNREFRVSPGDYRPWSLTPFDCVKLCGNMKYNFAALQNGNLCLCTNSFNSSRAKSSNCNLNCTGDRNYHCGGTWANSVYNSSSYTDKLVLNYFSSLAVFEWVNLTAEFVNRSDPGLSVTFNIGDENGESPGNSTEFKFRASYWGEITVTARPLNVNPKMDYIQRDVYIQAKPGRAELKCPSAVRTGVKFHCTAKIYEGTSLGATWQIQDGNKRNISLPNPLYVRAGPAVPQWVVPGLTSAHGSGVFLLPSSQFSSEARILALEIYGHTAGQIRIFIMRPVCKSPTPHYCPSNLSCTYHQCVAQPTHHCVSPDTFCASKSCCFLPPSENCTQSSNSTTLHALNLKMIADLGELTIGTGYNLHVLPKSQTVNALPGDMIAWGPATDGKIAQKSGKGTVYHFSGVDANSFSVGSEISINQSTVISDLSYMVNIIGSQASTFELSHQINTPGEYWVQVRFWDTLGNDLPPITQRVLVQTPLTGIKVVYTPGFSFYGSPINRNVEMIVNISTDGNVTVSWSLLNISSLLKHQILQSSGHGYVVDKMNHTFPSLGMYLFLVEAENNVSLVNSTFLVNVQDAISNLNASLISTPVYLGASTKLNVTVVGTNVQFKWIFGDGLQTPYISNTTVVHRFSKTGKLNVSVIATNLASKLKTWFLVQVLHPLSISVPQQGSVSLMINSSCSLAGPFAADQYYYWDHGDGSKEEGLNKTQVSHVYTRGGKYLVSVKLQNEVLVDASSEILVIEPVSGLTLDNFTGVELFDNQTFIARTTTGNNLTYEWYLHGNDTIIIMICASNSIEFHFNQTGFYTISVNASNFISSAFASLSFCVQQRIAGLGITAFPNPAPSNSTITFNITKGSGTDVKYRLDFGDGFVLRQFPENNLFNRTFSSGQWQVIYRGGNAVNHVIVFYNVTVQDPVENITVSVEAETEFRGRKLVATGADTRFYSNVTAGTDVYFRWTFGDGSGSYAFKGTENPSGGSNHTVGHSFPRGGQFNVSVEAFNAISLLRTWITVHAQQKIEGFSLLVTDRASPGERITFGFSQTKGDNVSYVIDYGDGGPSEIVTANSAFKTYSSVGVYNVSVEAVNQINLKKAVKTIAIQRKIQGLAFVSPIKVVETGLPTVISWRITEGSNVTYVIDYQDESAIQVLDANIVGMNVTVSHNYTSWGEFEVEITAYNLVGPNKTITGKAVVDDKIDGLVAYAQRSRIIMFENAVIVVSILKGSRVTYEFDFADGSDPVRTTNNTVIHYYTKHGVFNASVTARNALTTVPAYLNSTITVEKPSTPLEIRGLNVSCQATTPGTASEIRITYEYGFLFQCKVDLGDGTELDSYNDSSLPSPLLHTYSTVGSFEVTVKCENEHGTHRVNTTAQVDELITGLRFKSGNGVIHKEFGQIVDIEWIWTTGTNVKLSVTLSGHGSIASRQPTSQSGFIQLGPALCLTPGEYTVDIELSNSVSPVQKLTATATFTQKISGLSVSFNPITRTGYPVPVYVTVVSGLDVKVIWRYGDGSDSRRQTKGYGAQKFIASHVYATQGSYEVEVLTSNQNSREPANGTITILDPVQGFSFHQNNTLSWPSRNIVLQFSRNSSSPDLLGAKYKIEFGNGENSEEITVDPKQTQFTHSYSYSKPGCYKAKLIIWNFVSRVELTAPVDIIEHISNASLNAMHSKYSAHPGSPGGGPTGNTFPSEYPVSFAITQDTGTCLKYDWKYGDFVELKDVTTPVTTHAYPMRGTYNVTANVSNSLGMRFLQRAVTLQNSVMGLYLAVSGLARPGESITFVVFCARLGTDSRFVFNTGDETLNITIENFRNNSKLKAERKIDPNIKLPFDPSSYFAKNVSYVYSSQGVFEAQVWAWNEASQQSARASVVVTDKDVPVPHVTVIGGQKSLVNSIALIYGSRFALSSHVEIQSKENYAVTFNWAVYKADTYSPPASSLHPQLPPESGREVRLPSEVFTNQSSVTVPAFGLDPGEYIFQLTVTITGIGVNNADHTFIKIAGADIDARIAGGDLRSHDWGQSLVLDATESRDPLSSGKDDLTFVWFCEITNINPGIVKSGGGCFGNGEGQVEYTGKIFPVEARRLFEGTTYMFTVNISSVESGRWSRATQKIIVSMGNPPNIRMRCFSNCGRYLNPSRRLILATECPSCDGIHPITYNWSAVDVQASVPLLVWPERALTSRNSPYAAILEGTFNSGTSYIIKVVASRPNSAAQGIAEYNIVTNIPPKGGKCDVTPNAGEELDTIFTFSCSGWQDDHQPLTYEMFYSHPEPGPPQNSVPFFFGPSLTSHKAIFPVGKKEYDYFINITVIIRDAYGEFVDKKLRIQVKPRLVTQMELVNKTLVPGNEMEKAVGLGAVQEVVQLINAISDILNEQNASSDYMVEKKKEVRLVMIKYLASFRPQTLNDVLLGSKSLKAATAVAAETEVEAQVLATGQYANMVAMLTKESQGREDGGVIETIATEILQGLSNIFLASSGSSSDSDDTDKKAAEEVTFKILNLVDEVSDAMLYTMIPGQNPLVKKSANVAIGLSKQEPSNLAGISVDVGGLGQFALPRNVNLIDGSKNYSYVTTTVTELSMNPFQSSSNSSLVKSNPFSLVLKGSDGNVIAVEGLTSPIDILLPQEVSEQVPLNITKTPSSNGSMTFHKVSIPNNDSVIISEILPSDNTSKLTIYLRYNEKPSLTEYDFKTTLPNRYLAEGNNYTLFVSRDQMKGKGEYYIGVWPSAHGKEEVQTVVNYTFDVICSACYFWDEEVKEWSSKGCQVHNKTTRHLTHCQCSHLTWFGADLFIPPNKLDIENSLKKLPEVYKHPALLATFCVIIGLYILGLVWARRKDRRDITKVGLVPVLDNDPSDRYRYEVTVYTARGKNTGTTANVSILVAGEDGQSAVHTLKSTSESCLHPGGIDSFLITTSECLGSLTFIRIWHDNTGKSPSWFLSQVVIRDIETDEKFFFLCNQWLACDEGDGQVDRLFPVAGKDELRDFVHLFKTKTSRDLSDGHLWFSIAFRPVRSRFTCVQRVSCCLSLLMCSMLANVLWYRTPVKEQNNVLIDLGFFEFTWHEILIGVQSSLIVFPINLLIVQLFRNRAVSPKTKQKYAERTRRESNYPTERPRKPTAVSLSDITPTDSQRSSVGPRQKHVQLKNLTSIRSPVAARKDSWDEELFCSLLKSQIGVLPDSKKSEPKKEKPAAKDDHNEGEVPDFLSSDIYYYLYQDEARDHDREVCPGSICSGDSVDTTTELVKTEKPKKKKKRKLNCLFPWWFVYIGWLLCFSTAVIAGFFTLLYGLSFDNKQQEEWLVSMFVSMAQDILISQPLKVVIVAIFFALLLKKPQDEEDDVINAELARDEEWLEQNLTQAQKRDAKAAVAQYQRPPDKVLLHAARVRLVNERKMHSVIREIVFYFMFVWVVLLIAYGHRDPYAHFMTQNMENTFVGHQESLDPREEDKTGTKKPAGGDDVIKLYDVANVNDFWDWMNQTLVPGLYNGLWYNGKLGQPGFLNDKMSFVVGVARIRQLRVKDGTCEVAKVFNVHMGACNEPYSWDAEDQTTQYAPGWKPANQTSSSSPEYSAWRYRTTAELKTRPFLGHLALYRGGGYKADLGSTTKAAYSVLDELKSNNWVDKYTRAVFIEFTVYNGHSNLYCVMNLLLEITAAGGVVPFVQLLSTRIDRYVGNFLLFVLICEGSFVLFTLVFTYRELKRLLKTDLKEYMTAFWTWIEIALLSLSWTSIVLYFIRFGLDRLTKKAFREHPQEFVDFHHLALVDQLFGYVYAFVVFMISVKFLRLFRFNRRMSLLGSTLKCAAKELLHFGIIFGLVFVGFSHLCYLVFSHELYKFHTFVTTVETLISVMLGKFSYVSLERTNRVLGPVMFFFYSIGVVFILVNMFLSIIIENFKRVKRNNDLQSNEYEIVDFMTEQFLGWLGLRSRSIFKNRVFAEGEFERPVYKKRKRKNEAAQLKERVDRLVSLIQKVHFDGTEEDFLRNDGEVTYLVPDIKLESYA